MKLSHLSYELPDNLIADSPADPRDGSRLMVINRKTASIRHKHFYDLSDILSNSDVLVFNDTKVFPARFFGKRETGGRVEVLFLRGFEDDVWEILGKNIPKPGKKIIFNSFYSKVIEKSLHTAKIRLFTGEKTVDEILYSEGKTPIPPYINSDMDEESLRTKYQTSYAKISGSVAAPTAGLHFTNELLDKLRQKGVSMEYITLHAGMGTFAPIKDGLLENHRMHSEWFSFGKRTADRLSEAKNAGKRIISVGTTTARVLESCAINGNLLAKTGETDIFIYPPYQFKFIDGLVTNFHLPRSTLLALVSAFVSMPNTENEFENFKTSFVGEAYKEAIEKKYRFYSFGDGMIIV